jgi:hypothetical protein
MTGLLIACATCALVFFALLWLLDRGQQWSAVALLLAWYVGVLVAWRVGVL